MTEYNYSVEAHEQYMATMERTATWADSSGRQFINPFPYVPHTHPPSEWSSWSPVSPAHPRFLSNYSQTQPHSAVDSLKLYPSDSQTLDSYKSHRSHRARSTTPSSLNNLSHLGHLGHPALQNPAELAYVASHPSTPSSRTALPANHQFQALPVSIYAPPMSSKPFLKYTQVHNTPTEVLVPDSEVRFIYMGYPQPNPKHGAHRHLVISPPYMSYAKMSRGYHVLPPSTRARAIPCERTHKYRILPPGWSATVLHPADPAFTWNLSDKNYKAIYKDDNLWNKVSRHQPIHIPSIPKDLVPTGSNENILVYDMKKTLAIPFGNNFFHIVRPGHDVMVIDPLDKNIFELSSTELKAVEDGDSKGFVDKYVPVQMRRSWKSW